MSGYNTVYEHKHLMPAFKDSGEGVVWAYFAATGPGHLPNTESTIELCVTMYSRVKCEAICQAAKAWPKFCHATGQ